MKMALAIMYTYELCVWQNETPSVHITHSIQSDAHTASVKRKKKYTMSIIEEHLKELMVCTLTYTRVHFMVSAHFTACNIL